LLKVINFLPESFVDLLIIDPPYNLTKTFNNNLFSRKSIEEYAKWVDEFLSKNDNCSDPEEIIDERFGISTDEGAAHLYAGDITLNHIGGGFLYTNRDTLSVGAVYHFDSLLTNPIEPYTLIDALLKNPMVSEFIKDEVPVKPEIDKNLPQEEKLRIRFGVAKLIKNWYEIREAIFLLVVERG
jgi:hypothetical protein